MPSVPPEDMVGIIGIALPKRVASDFASAARTSSGNALIGLREGLEAALVVAILVAFLVRTGRRSELPRVWAGVALAVAVSVGVTLGLTLTQQALTFSAQEALGGSLSPFSAWLMLKGLETIELRVKAQAESAMRIAEALSQESKLTRVLYPGLPAHPQHDLAMRQMGAGGTVVVFDAGSRDAAFKILNALDIVIISNNLGDAKSIATHPASTTHQRLPEAQKSALGITPGLIRLSVGLEDAEDLIADLRQAIGML